MTKKEKDLKVLEAFNLKIGDRVKINSDTSTHIFKGDIFVITERAVDGAIVLCQKKEDVVSDNVAFNVCFLIDESWTKVITPLEEKRCDDFNNCNECPLGNFKGLNCGDSYIGDFGNKTMGEIYNVMKRDLDKIKKEIFGDEK